MLLRLNTDFPTHGLRNIQIFLIHVVYGGIWVHSRTLSIQDLNCNWKWLESKVLDRYVTCAITSKNQYPTLFTMAPNSEASLSDYRSEKGWNIRFMLNINDWELDNCAFCFSDAIEPPPTLQLRSDSLKWKYDLNGIFTVKSCYQG